MAAFGIADIFDEEKPAFEVFPENEQAVRFFLLMSSQWRMGTGGPTGLDYPALFQLFSFYDITDKQQVFDGVRVMELAVLEDLAKEK